MLVNSVLEAEKSNLFFIRKSNFVYGGERMTYPTTPYANSVFEQPWWLDIVSRDSWGEVLLEEKNVVIARMPFVKHNKHLCMPKMTQTLGIWMAPELRKPQNGNGHFKLQKETIWKLLDKLPHFKSMDVCLDHKQSYILPFRWRGYSINPMYSYRIEDLSNIDVVFNNFAKGKIRDIKQAEKKVEIKKNPNPKEMYDLFSKTFSTQGRKPPYEFDFVREVIEKSIEHNSGKLLIAWDGKNNHAGAFLVYDQRVCYYLLAGQDYDFRNSCAQSLIVWEAIKFASLHSLVFDFEGSMVEGIEDFFRQFGGQQVTYYNIKKQSFVRDLIDSVKPRIKKLLRYKI